MRRPCDSSQHSPAGPAAARVTRGRSRGPVRPPRLHARASGANRDGLDPASSGQSHGPAGGRRDPETGRPARATRRSFAKASRRSPATGPIPATRPRSGPPGTGPCAAPSRPARPTALGTPHGQSTTRPSPQAPPAPARPPPPGRLGGAASQRTQGGGWANHVTSKEPEPGSRTSPWSHPADRQVTQMTGKRPLTIHYVPLRFTTPSPGGTRGAPDGRAGFRVGQTGDILSVLTRPPGLAPAEVHR